MIDFNFSRFCFAVMMVVIGGICGMAITISATTLTVSATTGIDNVTAIVIIVVVIVLTGGDPTQRTIVLIVTTIEFPPAFLMTTIAIPTANVASITCIAESSTCQKHRQKYIGDETRKQKMNVGDGYDTQTGDDMIR